MKRARKKKFNVVKLGRGDKCSTKEKRQRSRIFNITGFS